MRHGLWHGCNIPSRAVTLEGPSMMFRSTLSAVRVGAVALAISCCSSPDCTARLTEASPVLALRWDQPRHTRDAKPKTETMDFAAADEKIFIPAVDPAWVPGVQQVMRLDARSNLGLGLGANVNRVDGLSFLSRQAIDNRTPWGPSVVFYEGYGTESKRWSGAGEIRIHAGVKQLQLGARWSDETTGFFEPRSALTAEESFVAASLLREDFANYLRRRSRSAILSWLPARHSGIHVMWSEEEHRSLERVVSRYGPFGGHKRFGLNPAVAEGDWTLLRVRAAGSGHRPKRIDRSSEPRTVLLEAEWGGGALGDGRAFTRVWGEHRGFIALSPSQTVGYRVTGGFAPVGSSQSTGSRLPEQWQFQAGGIGSLRGHRFQEFSGDRLLLGTIDYQIDPGDAFKTALFLDTGMAWNDAESQSGGVGGSGPLALDGGIGITLGDERVRVDVARDLRRERASARVTARLSVPY